jgi:alanine dehydrogenase
MGTGTKIKYSEFYTKGHFEPLEEKLAIAEKHKTLSIGIPKETTMSENRIGIVPHTVLSLVGAGLKVKIEAEAGSNSYFTDLDFSESGAEICYNAKEVLGCNIVIKTAPPTIEEINNMSPDAILISPLLLPMIDEEYIDTLMSKRITAIAMEYLQASDGSFPIVRIMSEIAGISSMITAGELLKKQNGGRAVLLGGITGVPPAKVVILGAGVVGLYAVKTALGLGASVRIFDNDMNKIMRMQANVGRQLHTSNINPKYLAHQLTSADVVIGALHSKVGRTPIIISEEMVSKMKEGSIIMDISIDQGGCIETSKVTTHEDPTFVKHGVIHYCVPNIASQVARTASIAISNIMTTTLFTLNAYNSVELLLENNPGIKNGCYTYKGCLTNEYLSRKFNKKYTNLSLILSSML